jgi:TonB family protein
MRIVFLTLFFFCFLFKSQAQNDSLSKQNKGNSIPPNVRIVFEGKLPVFPNGGNEGFQKYIKDTIVLPAGKTKHGTVTVEYTIEKDGTVSNVKITPGKGLSRSYDQAVIDVVSKSPEWLPAEQNGMPIQLRITRIIAF